jgi:hypothetical protein
MASEIPEKVKRPIRTVTDPVTGRPDAEMDIIGWLIVIPLVILALPILPLIVVYVFVSWLIDALRGRGPEPGW